MEGHAAQRDLEARRRLDLHDLVGHGLSLVAVQSGVARLALAAGDVDAAVVVYPAPVEAVDAAAPAEVRQPLPPQHQHLARLDAGGDRQRLAAQHRRHLHLHPERGLAERYRQDVDDVVPVP